MMLRTYLILAGIIAVLASAAAVRFIDADRDKWRAAAGDYKAASVRWHSLFDQSEALRRTEARQAVSAVDEARKSCNAELAAQRASTKAIKRVITLPVKTDAAGCPIRRLLTADELRASLRPGDGR